MNTAEQINSAEVTQEAKQEAKLTGLAVGAETTLDAISPGSTVTITELRCENPYLYRKLSAMGLVAGRIVKVMRCAPLGDPISISTLGYTLSLRLSEAREVVVTLLS